VLGALVGLIRGLSVDPSTAWFAVFEAGVPAFFVGAIIGSVVGVAARVIGCLNNRRADTNHQSI
jgi:hypothetical protein